MIYDNIRRGMFLDRPNRFIARIEIDGSIEICHVKNTGRCRELLVPGATVLIQGNNSPARKTKYDLIAVYKGVRLVNIDSSAPNRVFAEWLPRSGLFQHIALVKPEQRFGASRFDFYVEGDGRRAFVEVKGVTLENDGRVSFPDAPTERGLKHIKELVECVRAGYEGYAIFIVQMAGVRYFEPNRKIHPAFADTLRVAADQGVKVLALDCQVTENSITPGIPVEVRLGSPSR